MSVITWLQNKIAEETGMAVDEVNCDESFESFSLDSLATISISYDIEQEYGLEELNPTVFSEYSSINKLATWIESQR
jgi:acyl carrier protein